MNIFCVLGMHDWEADPTTSGSYSDDYCGENCERCKRCGEKRSKGHDWVVDPLPSPDPSVHFCKKCKRKFSIMDVWRICPCAGCNSLRQQDVRTLVGKITDKNGHSYWKYKHHGWYGFSEDWNEVPLSLAVLVERLETDIKRINDYELEKIGSISDITILVQSGACDGPCGSIDIDCSVAIQMARQELVRRGFSVQSKPKEIKRGTVTDVDGNVYKTVTIGKHVWMAENLKVTHYRNGDAIPNVSDKNKGDRKKAVAAWSGLSTGAYCEYCDYGSEKNSGANYVAIYGRLYNWFATNDSRKLAPAGWHIPTNAEWQTLIDCLGGEAVAGGKLKEAGRMHWESPNKGATNEFGFSGLPGGNRDKSGYTSALGQSTLFWSATELDEDFSSHAWSRCLHYLSSDADRLGNDKRNGFSVRCVKD